MPTELRQAPIESLQRRIPLRARHPRKGVLVPPWQLRAEGTHIFAPRSHFSRRERRGGLRPQSLRRKEQRDENSSVANHWREVGLDSTARVEYGEMPYDIGPPKPDSARRRTCRCHNRESRRVRLKAIPRR